MKRKAKIALPAEERFSSATPERPACLACALFVKCKTPFMKPFVPRGWTGKLLLVGEAPGADEDTRSGRPFSGPSGKLLQSLWREAGFHDTDIALHNAVRCRPKNNATPSMAQVRACRPFLLRAISLLRPKYILGIGGTALRALTDKGANNVTAARGRPLAIPRLLEVLPEAPAAFVTYHPAAILHGNVALRERIREDFVRLLAQLAERPSEELPESAPCLAVDTEFAPDGELLTVAVANKSRAFATEDSFDAIGNVLRDTRYLVGHSAAGDLGQLAKVVPLKEEWITGEQMLDSLLLARMVDENGGKGAYELENLLANITTVAPWKQDTVRISKKDATKWPVDLRKERCRLDAWASYRVAEHYYEKLHRQKELVTYTHRIASVLERLRMTGAMVDLADFETMKGDLEVKKNRAADMLAKAAAQYGMPDFSPTNDNHIRELLYDKLGLEIQGRTKKAKLPSVDAVTLKNLDHDIPRLLLEHNRSEKLWSVNGEGLSGLIRPCGVVDGRAVGWLPFRINPLGARTGRRSATAPNSQNWPNSVRRIVGSRYVNGLIGDFDYRRLEVVLIAWIAGDEKLLEAFTTGRGYLDVAKELWGTDVEEGTPQYRATKSIVLGVNYNMQGPKMARELWNKAGVRLSADYAEHEAQTEEARAKYLRQHYPLVRYMEARETELLRTQQVVSLTGRIRHLPLSDGRRTPGFWHLLNQAINFPIQSLASEITGSALLDIEKELLAANGADLVQYYQLLSDIQKYYLTNPSNCDIIVPVNWSFIFNEVHDSIVMDLHPDNRKRDIELVVETMRAVPSLRKLCPQFAAPLACDMKLGPRWGEKN